MSSALESEDLENVPLVRMEDVQPSRTYELMPRRQEIVVLETCVIENIEYDNECIVNDDDDDSNIGSMVSIKSEDNDYSEPEMIIPEMMEEVEHVLEPITTYHGLKTIEEIKEEEDTEKPPSSWPTLEILPGGVIKKPQQLDPLEFSPSKDDPNAKPEEMMYACAKCPQRFKFLFCLVKHVKLHEDETKKLVKRAAEYRAKICNDFCTHKKKRKMVAAVNAPKKKSPKKIKS